MPLIIRDTSTVPDGPGWAFPGLNGHMIVTRNYSIFYDEVVKHFTANGQQPPTRQEVTDWQCSNLAVPCHDGPVPFINRFTQGLPSATARHAGCCGK